MPSTLPYTFLPAQDLQLGWRRDRTKAVYSAEMVATLGLLMEKSLDETQSLELAEQIKSKAKRPFDNAYRAALATKGSTYVQGFLALPGKPYHPIEHSWIELDDRIIDPTLPYLNRSADTLHYFCAQRLSVKELKAAIEEAKEDYPEDDPLPIYGKQPYEYYGDVMLGGKEYVNAYEAAAAKCKELNPPSGNGKK